MDTPQVVVVGQGELSEKDLLALSKAKTVIGPAALVEVVRHLCPPTASVIARDESIPRDEPVAPDMWGIGAENVTFARPVVILRPAAQVGEAVGAGEAFGARNAFGTSDAHRDRDALHGLIDRIHEPDAAAREAARALQDQLAKPPGSLGQLEEVGVRLAALTGRCPPTVPATPAVLVAAADHGVVAQGVSAWPSSVTAAMVGACIDGRAAVSVLAVAVGAPVTVLDVGLASDVPPAPNLVRAKTRRGTDDLSMGPAMAPGDALEALQAGARAVSELIDAGTDVLAVGDLGIGNTTASACLVAAFTGADADGVVGRGAGADDAVLQRKRQVVAAAIERHGARRSAREDPLTTLSDCGGLEHAALVGAILAAAGQRVPVLLDGIITVAAALVAAALAPHAGGALFAGHESAEPGSAVGLRALGLRPLLRLDMRLGEGTGAVLAVPLLQAAARTMSEMGRLRDVAPPG